MVSTRLPRSEPSPSDRWTYKTPGKPQTAEIKEKGSRFIAHLNRAQSPDEALAFLEELRKRYHDATHHCWAYRIGWGEELEERFSDAGEPSHSAGRPILNAMTRMGVSDAVLVVVRFFGGVKLGVGGLARAYRDGSQAALEQAGLIEKTLGRECITKAPYAAQGALRRIFRRYGVELQDESFSERWEAEVEIPMGCLDRFEGAMKVLREDFRGEVEWKLK